MPEPCNFMDFLPFIDSSRVNVILYLAPFALSVFDRHPAAGVSVANMLYHNTLRQTTDTRSLKKENIFFMAIT